MARWVQVVVGVLVCMVCVDAERGAWSSTREPRERLLGGDKARLSGHRGWPESHRTRLESNRERLESNRERLESLRERLESHRERLESHRERSRWLTVPEPVDNEREDPATQLERLWNQWLNGTQSDQPDPKLPAFVLKHQLSSRHGVNQLRSAGPTRAFDNFDIMNDAGVGQSHNEDMQQVIDLYTVIMTNYSCREPSLQLVTVSEVHPSRTAMYLPHSVPLRRCSDSAGCCSYDYLTCVSAANVIIELPIWVNHIVGNREQVVKRLSFVEDTECKCVKKSKPKWQSSKECSQNSPVNDESNTTGPRMGGKQERRRSSRKHKPAQQECHCPSEFASRPMPKGRCKCDCFDGNRKCKRQRRGRVSLSETDNRCIVRGICKPPDCKHGRYETTRGRCPRNRGEWRRDRFVV